MKGSDGKVEWRLCCAKFGVDRYHRSHSWHVGPRNTKDYATAVEFLASRNADPVMLTASYHGCLPLRLECRYIGPWTPHWDDAQAGVEWWSEAFGTEAEAQDAWDASHTQGVLL